MFVVVKGLGGWFVSKKVVKTGEKKMTWNNKANLTIRETILPDAKFEGALNWMKLCDLAKAGEIPTVSNFTVDYYICNGIWCTAGSSKTMAGAIEIANKTDPEPFDGRIPNVYMVTSTGEMVLADDWDAIEGDM